MMVPSHRLIFWTGAVLLPSTIIMAVTPGAFPLLFCGIAAFLVLVLLDASRAIGLLDGIHIEVDETVRLTKGREGQITLRIRNASRRPCRLRFGLALPRAIASPYEVKETQLPESAEQLRIDWPCTPRKRGRYRLEKVYLETPSPFGFWRYRQSSPAPAELRVYPNLLAERNRLAALFLNRGGAGIHAQRRVGKGRDFEKLREYIPGDSYEDIHWKATARRAHPITKVYQIERTQEVYVVIDASRLSAREDGETSQLDRFIQAAMVLGLVAEKQGDLFGLLTFNDRIRTFIRARNGLAHHNICRDALYTLEAETVNPDFEELSTFIHLHLRRRALLVLLTNLDDPVLAESFSRTLDLVTRRHLVLVNMITPPGLHPLFSDPSVDSVDAIYQELGGHLRWRDLREVQRVLHHRGVAMSLLEDAMLTPGIVSQYLSVKQRQLL